MKNNDKKIPDHQVPHQEQHDHNEEQFTRRSFLKAGIGALSVIAALEVGGISLMFMRSRSVETRVGGVVTVGEVEEFPNNSVTEFNHDGFFLIRADDGKYMAVSSKCPHLGCSVIWVPEKNRFICPCHASSFDFYGDYDSPPVPRPLDTYEMSISEGKLLVDTSRVSRREKFSPDQMIDPGVASSAEVAHD